MTPCAPALPVPSPLTRGRLPAFTFGCDARHIVTVGADSVALAAIQGLNQKLEVRSQKSEDRILALEAENAGLKVRLTALEHLLQAGR